MSNLKKIPVKISDFNIKTIFSDEEKKIIDSFTGYLTFTELVRKYKIEIKDLMKLFEDARNLEVATTVYDWNNCYYDKSQNTYFISDDTIDITSDIIKLSTSFPCDPKIAIGKQLDFISDYLCKAYNQNDIKDKVIHNAFVVNTYYVGYYIWELFLLGELIGKIHFRDTAESAWEYEEVITKDKLIQMLTAAPELEAVMENSYRRNKQRIISLEENAVTEIKMLENDNPIPTVSFSGGKDSMAILELTRQAGINCYVITVEEEVMHAETIKFIKELFKTEKYKHYKVIYGRAEKKGFFTEGVQSIATGYEWCDFKKLEVLNNTITNVYKGKSHRLIKGTRRHEQANRVIWASRKIKENYHLKEQAFYLPIRDWTQFDEWCYFTYRDVPVNPVYEQGWERSVCWCCPGGTPYQIWLARTTYPGWNVLTDALKKYNIPEKKYFHPIETLGKKR